MTDDFRGVLDQLLEQHRPDRYTPGVDDDWMQDVANAIAHLIPPSTAVERYALAETKAREAVKTRRTNQELRLIYRSGQLPLDWFELSSMPISAGKERVALRACTPDDFEQSAIEERRAAAQEFSARSEACDAREWIAEQMRSTGAVFGRDWFPSLTE